VIISETITGIQAAQVILSLLCLQDCWPWMCEIFFSGKFHVVLFSDWPLSALVFMLIIIIGLLLQLEIILIGVIA
jgi:hypothetical protein